MVDNIFGKQLLPKSILQLLRNFLIVLSLSIVFTFIVYKEFVKHLDVYHTILEALCVFIAMTIFLSVWYVHQYYTESNFLMGFGYLAVALFDALHTFYHLKVDLNPNSYYDLSTRFWIIGRLTEAATLFLSTRRQKMMINKWTALAGILGYCSLVYLTAAQYHDILPVLLTQEGVTPFKVFLEYVVIAVYCISLFRVKGSLAGKSNNLSYQYIFLAILSNICAEFMFTLYFTVSSFPWALGHILKIISYFFLLHGVFISTIIYPYKKLEEKHHLLLEKNDMIVRDQEKLIQQEKLALLGQMGAGIVHETRNYLTTIKGSSQLISLLTKEEKVKKYADAIDHNVDEVNTIISEFLFLSKPRETKLDEVSLSHIVSAIKSIVETDNKLKGINVEFHLSSEERNLLCDESQLKQVILNLCRNAGEAMVDIRDARLLIETGLDKKHNMMLISISDNGRGIPDEEIKKLGTPFYTTKKSGTGLGLSVCYKIIENHGGKINVNSKKNEGTTFTLCLPCTDPAIENEYDGLIV